MTVVPTVEVLLFARLREVAGTGSLTVELPVAATARAAWEAAVRCRPALAGGASALRVAVNERYATWETTLQSGDVVAFLPPVAGGSTADVHVLLTADRLDPRACEALVRTDADGAVCTFTGVVRDHVGGEAVTAIVYEAYAAMAEGEICRIAREVLAATGATAVAVHHRVGELAVGEASVVVSASAAHRAEAFDACRRTIDAVKERAPIWKHERRRGGAVWVGDGAAAPGGEG